MKYMGSKSRVVKDIVPIIQHYIDASNAQYYIEPFCGGCNVIQYIKAPHRIAIDNHPYLIALLQNLNKLAELPTAITKEHYNDVRNCFNKSTDDYEEWYVGAIGFLASYNGRFFDGGYAGVVTTKAGVVRDYYAEAKRNLQAQTEQLIGVEFRQADYQELNPNTEGCVLYCDPPYNGVKQYGSSKHFDHTKFWDWVRAMSKKNYVIVSEHAAPDDFDCIWSQPVLRTIDNTKRVKTIEKLFMWRGGLQ